MVGRPKYMHSKKGVLKGWHKGTHAHHNIIYLRNGNLCLQVVDQGHIGKNDEDYFSRAFRETNKSFSRPFKKCFLYF